MELPAGDMLKFDCLSRPLLPAAAIGLLAFQE